MPNDNFSKNWPLLLGLIIFLLVYAYLFKFAGARFIFTIIIFTLPSYLILNLFDLDEVEKIIFSFFLSISIISSPVYWLSFVTNSIRVAFLLLVIFLTIIAIILNVLTSKNLLFFKEKHKPKEN